MKTCSSIVSVSFDRFPARKGAATHIGEFASALGREFGNVHLLTVKALPHIDGLEHAEWSVPGVTHWPLPAEGGSLFERVLGFRAHMWDWWRRQFGSRGLRPETVHIRSIYEGYPIATHKQEFCRNLIFEVNGLPSIELKYHYPSVSDDRELVGKLREQEQVCLAAADRIITVSHVNARHLASLGVPTEKITVIPNGADLELFTFQAPRLWPDRAAFDFAAALSAEPSEDLVAEIPTDGHPVDRYECDGQDVRRTSGHPASSARFDSSDFCPDPLRMLYAGTMSPWQGVQHAIQALALYRRDFPATLTLAGPCRARERRDLLNLAWKSGVSESLDIRGPVSKEELASLHHAADVVLAPLTRNDRNCDQGCCPLKVLEALASGTPLIASDLEVVRELCVGEEHGLLVRPGSGKAIKDAMLRIRFESGLATRLSHAGRRHVETRFPWSAATGKLIDCYRSL